MKWGRFLTKPIVKTIIIGLLSIFVSITTALLDDFSPEQSNYGTELACFIVAVVVEFAYLIWVACAEVNERRKSSELDRQINAFKKLNANIIKICSDNALSINHSIHTAEKEKKIYWNIWNFDAACSSLCHCIYVFLEDFIGSSEIEVTYIRRREEPNKERIIYLNSFANANNSHPSIYRKDRDLSTDQFYDAQLFKNDKADLEVLVDSEEINRKFSHPNRNYSQYIAIPVMCDTKMIGLLEVVTFSPAVFASSKKRSEIEGLMREIGSKYLVPYSWMFLLLHKTEKALLLGTQKG